MSIVLLLHLVLVDVSILAAEVMLSAYVLDVVVSIFIAGCLDFGILLVFFEVAALKLLNGLLLYL
jgi:hypothetical protein